MTDNRADTSSLPGKLTCQQVTDLIIDYVTQEMDATLRAVFERHLHNCPDCTAFLQTYCRTMHVTRTLRYEEVPAEMLTRVQQFLHARLKQTPEAP